MTHISEERNIEAPPERIWAVIASTPRWMEFYRTHDNRGRLKKAEYLGKEADEVGARRRMHFVPGLPWDEECVRFDPPHRLEWRGVRTPGMKYYQTILELVPGSGFTTLRWDLYFELSGWSKVFVKKKVKRVLEDATLTALLEIDRLSMKPPEP